MYIGYIYVHNKHRCLKKLILFIDKTTELAVKCFMSVYELSLDLRHEGVSYARRRLFSDTAPGVM